MSEVTDEDGFGSDLSGKIILGRLQLLLSRFDLLLRGRLRLMLKTTISAAAKSWRQVFLLRSKPAQV